MKPGHVKTAALFWLCARVSVSTRCVLAHVRRLCNSCYDSNNSLVSGHCSQEASNDHHTAGVCHRLQHWRLRHELWSRWQPFTHVSHHTLTPTQTVWRCCSWSLLEPSYYLSFLTTQKNVDLPSSLFNWHLNISITWEHSLYQSESSFQQGMNVIKPWSNLFRVS